MNKKVLMFTCLAMMTIVFSGCNLFGGDKNQETPEAEFEVKQNQKSSGNEDGSYFETMQNLMKRGKTMKCTYTQKIDGGGTATGVVYMADKNARTEITVNEGTDHAGKMYSITDHEYNYSWVEGSSKGYKMTIEAVELDEKMKTTVSNLGKEIDFKCKSWKKDSSKFKVPTNIVFDDMSEMMGGFQDVDLEQEIKDAEAMGDEFICEICKSAPASEMEECLGGVVCE